VEGQTYVLSNRLSFKQMGARKAHRVRNQDFFKILSFNFCPNLLISCRAVLGTRWMKRSSASALNVGSLTQRLQEDNQQLRKSCRSEG
jgi:hypothetical protein